MVIERPLLITFKAFDHVINGLHRFNLVARSFCNSPAIFRTIGFHREYSVHTVALPMRRLGVPSDIEVQKAMDFGSAISAVYVFSEKDVNNLVSYLIKLSWETGATVFTRDIWRWQFVATRVRGVLFHLPSYPDASGASYCLTLKECPVMSGLISFALSGMNFIFVGPFEVSGADWNDWLHIC